MKISATQYDQMAKQASPKSKSYKNVPAAFFVGGFICMLGELLRQLYIHWGCGKPEASTWVSITFIAITALLTGLNVFDKIAKFAGAGTIVPITGFANSVASPALEFKTEGMVLGLGAKMFIIAGPVIVYGTLASIVYGIVLWIIGLF